MSHFPHSTSISEIENPLSWTPEKQQLMVDACREMALFHYENSPFMKQFYNFHSFNPNCIQQEEDLVKIPAIGVSAMKKHLLLTLPAEKASLKLTSSGTKGIKTQIWFDTESLNRVQRMLDVTLGQEGLVSSEKTNYLIFGYNVKDAKNLGTAFTKKNQTRFAPAHYINYALEMDESGEWQFMREHCVSVFQEYEKEGKPVRILGMPAFLFEFVNFALNNNLSFKLPKGSVILTGGGWKAAEDKKVSRDEFREMCASVFGIPTENMRDGFGMVEHSAPYYECKHHRFHVPAFNRVIVRDPNTMEVLPAGEPGLMQLITPFNAMMPNLSILTTDWCSIDPDPCTCGHTSPTFTLLGRAGNSKHKGCAIHADDIVKRSQK